MTDSTPRKRFIHLSTTIAIALVTCALIWFNSARPTPKTGLFPYADGDITLHNNDRAFGWPFEAMYHSAYEEVRKNGTVVDKYSSVYWRTDALVIDVVVALVILSVLWFLCEWIIRRRAAQKGA